MNRKLGILIALFAATLVLAACASTRTGESAGEYIDDATITTKVKAQIFNDENVSASEVNVETFKGVVQLSGFVSSQADMDRAIEIARNVKGVKSVTNKMQLK